MGIRKYLLLLISLVLFSVIEINAQVNLVPNPSFEVYDTCPGYVTQTPNSYNVIYWSPPWFQPYLPLNSTDYFNICDTNLNLLGVPSNAAGFALPVNGSAYAGISTGYFQGNNYREYLEVELIDSLTEGFRYCVSFYVSCGDFSKRAGDGIGACLSKNIIQYNSPPLYVLNQYNPQVSNPSGNILDDTSNWVIISDTITAHGGEKFITIGNFKTDSATNWITINPSAPHLASYYYIDDVSVILCDSTTGIDVLTDNDVTISPNPASDKIKITLAYSFQKGARLKLVTSVGTVIIESDFKEEIDVSTLPNGIYFLSIETNRGKVIKKLIVDQND